MVRVVSAHHFLSQGIQTCDVPYAATTAPPDRLLLALSHQVEVRDLSSESEVKFTFPTVDQSHFLAYCAAGNYVASVERKVTRQGSEASYVRLYTGWEGGDTTAMRARIAGCVTPATSHIPSDSSLEIIELPLRFPNTSHIACCQVTGNIVVVCEKYVSLYQLVFRTHDISRLKFLDFEPWPVTLELSFAPSRLVLAEDVVAASDKVCLHVFRINKGFARPSDWSSSGSPLSTKGRIVYGAGKRKECKVVEEFRGPIPVDDLLREVSDVTSSPKYVSKLGNSGLPVLAMLPSIKCSLAHNPARNLRTSPFKPPHSVTMGIAVKETPANEPWAEQMTTMVESLLQLELGGTEGDSQGEMFTSVHLRPVYISTATPPSPHTNVELTPRRYMAQSEANFTSKNSCPRLRSTGYNDIVAFSCFITTMQEGFLYHFPVEDGEVMSLGRCISTYNFTSNVKFACVEPYLIHVLTSSGLETYTMRTANIIHHENTEDEACPPACEPVCLLGLRPFLGVVNLMLSQSHLVVLSSSDDDKSQLSNGGELTVYSLKLPSGAGLYADMLSVGETHRYTMRSVYSQLLNEAHSVLCAITRFSTKPRTPPDPRLVHLYKESCALLADYHLSCNTEEDHELGFKYAFMAELKPTQVMDRLKKIEAETKQVDGGAGHSWGLFYYLKRCLCERLSEESWLPPPVLNTLLDLVDGMTSQPFVLPHLILISPVLRQFSTERSVRIIQSHINHSGEGEGSVGTSDYLALAVLYVMRSKQSEAAESLEAIPSPEQGYNQTFVDTLVTYWQIIFDPITQVLSGAEWDWEGITFSDISVLLMDKKPVEFAMALSTLVCDSSSLQLEHILQVFLTYLPSSVGSSNSCSAGYVLQKFLQSVFSSWKLRNSNWKPEDNVDNEALKILMRSYLSDLVTKGDKYPSSHGLDEPFNVTRPKFLQLIPPLSVPGTKYHPSLINLQCLLCTGWLDESSMSELVQFVSEYVPQQLRLSLFILAQPHRAVDLLITHSTLAVPLYTKEMLKGETELKDVVSALQTRIEQEDDPTVYKQVLAELLEELARTLPCEELLKVVPPGEDYSDYILTCQRMAHANHIRSVIMATGQKLLQTLNL